MKKYIQSLLLTGIITITGAFAQTPANWQPLGPIQFPTNISGQINGIGRVCQMKFHPTNPQKVYAVSASGGLWISNDGTTTWTGTGTDAIALTACASVCVDYTNDSIIYLATGDPNYYSASFGIYKSTDEGATWAPSNTGIGVRMALEILMDPQDHLTLVAATNDGIWKTIDGGATWTVKKTGGQFTDMEIKPANGTRTLYAVNMSEFYKSEDFGDTWTLINNGIAVPGGGSGQGMRLAVSAADSNVVYAGMVKDEGTIFRSNDGGNTFTTVYHNPSQSLTGYDAGGNGQGNYNFTMVANPINANEVYVGSHVVWKSTDGGITWTQLTQWYAILHTDMHDMIFHPTNVNELYNINDGGVWRSTNGGTAWTPKSNGIGATEIYKAANDPKRKDIISIGTQDNGELYSFNNIWKTNRGGDWTSRVLFDYTNNNYVYYFENGLRRSLNNSAELSYGVPVTASNNMRMAFSAINTDYAMVGTNTLYFAPDISSSFPIWGLINTFTGTVKSVEFAAHSPELAYVITTPNLFWKGVELNQWAPTWTSSVIPTGVGNASSIASLVSDTNVVFITAGSKVYRSGDQGATWVNETLNLPNINIIKIYADPHATDESVYICNAYGVWYKNNTMSSWISYNEGLPAIANITDFMFYDDGPQNSVLRVATYGRGVWETPLTQTTGLYQAPESNLFSIYPNPAKDLIRMTPVKAINETVNIRLFNATGQKINELSQIRISGEQTMDISTLVNGIYNVQVLATDGKVLWTGSFVKE